MPPLPDLPITAVLDELRVALATAGLAVLEAPPGAGKTTIVPIALLEAVWLGDERIVMLEPRRLAARAAAARMASLVGETPGDTIGFRTRLETRVGPRTRIEVVTEGILTRMLQSDPALTGYGAVIFDEFHERNLPSDLGLALALESRAVLRPDLRLLVMSATLDGGAVARVLGDAPRIRSEGRLFPVETRYIDRPAEGRVEDIAARTVRQALREAPGDVLVFLPGAGEIRRTMERLGNLGEGVIMAPLFGALTPAEQDRAILPDPRKRRKVVLATDIAETSLTIEGVRVVIDSGLVRRSRYDPQRGMARLETVRIARDSADQRRGRAGRLGPGTCFRLWTEVEQSHLASNTPPEIVLADLAPLALELAAWGAPDPASLRWLDPPSDAAYGEARELLAGLGALDASGSLTSHGRAMAGLGMHPRLAHMALRGRDLGFGATAAELAALLNERDLLIGRQTRRAPADVRLRLDALRRSAATIHGVDVHRAAADRALKEARRWQRRLRIRESSSDPETAGLLLALAYPDRIAQRRRGSDHRYRLRNGQSAALDPADPLAEQDFLAVAHAGGLGAEARIFLAAPLAASDLEEHFAEQLETVDEIVWDDRLERVVGRRQVRLGAVVVRESPIPNPDPAAVAQALAGVVRERGLHLLPWDRESTQRRERLAFLHHLDPTAWPDVADDALLARADDWLVPHLLGIRSLSDLRKLSLEEALFAGLTWDRRRELDRLAPTHVEVPSGSRIRLDYSDPEAPVLAVRLQEVFGLTETPRIGGGAIPLTVHLLSPALRPVQVTRDLASFWREGYFDVRKDLRGRYPKHHWPEDPLKAEPTRRTRKH